MERPNIFNESVENIASFINMVTGDNKESIKPIIQELIKNKIQHPTIHNIIRRNGDLVIDKKPLTAYANGICKNNITITPSGSAYLKPSEKQGLIPAFEDSLKKDRNVAKKEMFEALKAGDKILAENKNFLQANKKISANALSGIMKSAYNLFYDVGGYNAITSVARTIVTLSFVTIEQLIENNFVFFNLNELINHVVLCIRHKPSDEIINNTMIKYRLNQPTKELVLEFLYSSIEPYERKLSKSEICSSIEKLLHRCSNEQLSYIYYYNNLKHIFQNNESVFKPWIQKMMSVDNIKTDDYTESDLYKINKEVLSILTTCNNELIQGRTLEAIIKDAPDIINPMVNISKYYDKYLSSLDDLFNTFIFTNFIPPKLNNKKNMFRKTVLLLDTDSNLFTTINWVRWFTGDEFSDRIENYQISSLIIYFIFKGIENMLHKFVRSCGVEDESLVKQLVMKNEFFYPVFLILPIKKNYVGLMTIQEGITLKKPKLDIKGVVLRSSSICRESSHWFENFIVNFFKKAQVGKIEAYEVIMEVVRFENEIRRSIEAGELTYLKYSSVRSAESYKKPYSSAFMYAEAWNLIFGPIYDEINLPTKVALVNINKPTTPYLDNLRESNEQIYNGYQTFIDKYGKFVNTIALHPLSESIPKELIPIINIRSIIYHNTSPAYIILKSVGITNGYKKSTSLLFSDIY